MRLPRRKKWTVTSKINNRIYKGTHKGSPYRSGLEDRIARELAYAGITAQYESTRISYLMPESTHTYTPDFLLPNGIYIETKGYFSPEDRKKHLLIKEQHPDLDIRFVFSSSRTKLRKGGKLTYGDWCKKNGFLFADKHIPTAWTKEHPGNKDTDMLLTLP